MKISVVTPSYNQAEFLERTISSVLSQDYPELEYIIMDGGSTDHSVEIIEKYSANIDHWVSEKDDGQTHAINKGFRMATGDILAWLNSDDVYFPHTLQVVADFFSSHPQIDVVYGRADYIDARDSVIQPYDTCNWSYDNLKSRCFICQPAVFFRRSVYEQFGALGESLDFCMDYEYWLRCGHDKPFFYLPEKLAASRLYAENKTLGLRPGVLQETLPMLFRKFHKVHRNWLGEHAMEITGSKRGYQPRGLARLSWSFAALKMYYANNIRYNRQYLPVFSLQMLKQLPVIPMESLRSMKRLISNTD